jgi:hypothetical protein
VSEVPWKEPDWKIENRNWKIEKYLRVFVFICGLPAFGGARGDQGFPYSLSSFLFSIFGYTTQWKNHLSLT